MPRPKGKRIKATKQAFGVEPVMAMILPGSWTTQDIAKMTHPTGWRPRIVAEVPANMVVSGIIMLDRPQPRRKAKR